LAKRIKIANVTRTTDTTSRSSILLLLWKSDEEAKKTLSACSLAEGTFCQGNKGRYCQLNATLGLFSLGSGEEGAFLESFFAKKHQKTAQKSAQWGKLIKGKL
jgi:hypothetical protein